MERPILRLALILAVCITASVLLTDRLPLGVPGEWTWDRVAITAESLAAAFLTLIVGAVYIGFALLGSRRINGSRSAERWGWLIALLAVSFSWMCGAMLLAPSPLGYSRVPWVLYYPRSSGYFWQARYEVKDTKTFLATYEDLLAEKDYLHIGTHPPGLTLAYRGLLTLCHRSPRLVDTLTASQPTEFAEAVAVIQATSSGPESMAGTDAACLWLAALLTQLAAALATLGIYGLAARHHDRRTAWMAACLWPLVPAIFVFLPKSDVLYPFVAVSAAWLWLSGCDRRSYLCAFLAGFVMWIGMLLSLAFVTIAVLIGTMTLWEAWTRLRNTEGDSPQWLSVPLVGSAIVGFVLPTIAMGVMFDVNLLNVWSWNLSNHALFYDHNVRTRWLWLLVNPLELGGAVGLPIVVAALFATVRLMRQQTWRTPQASESVAFVAVWGLLWVSGKNMGEAARLWILLMPWVVLCTASASVTPKESPPPRYGCVATWTLVAQLLVAILTIIRVDGFHFAQLVTG